MQKEHRKFDIVVYGASGYTGRLVIQHLWQRYGAHGTCKLAIGGRDLTKLEAVRTELGAREQLGILVADAHDLGALTSMAHATSIVIATVGPYQRHGTELVEACASVGTDYLDLCAEPHWIRRMIDTYSAQAKQSGAHILFSCGFDSIPSELGVLAVQELVKRQTGRYSSTVKCLVRSMKGGFSGGTAESLNANLEAAASDESVAALLNDPFCLTPGYIGSPQPETANIAYDTDLEVWTVPSMMAFINTKTVHRLNYLLGHRFGEDFLYDERMMTGSGEKGLSTAKQILASPSPLQGPDAPKPGTGPSQKERDEGSFELIFVARTEDGSCFQVGLCGDSDPGYGSTSKMIAETAMALLSEEISAPGGVWTAASAPSEKLATRLAAHAGIRLTTI